LAVVDLVEWVQPLAVVDLVEWVQPFPVVDFVVDDDLVVLFDKVKPTLNNINKSTLVIISCRSESSKY